MFKLLHNIFRIIVISNTSVLSLAIIRVLLTYDYNNTDKHLIIKHRTHNYDFQRKFTDHQREYTARNTH